MGTTRGNKRFGWPCPFVEVKAGNVREKPFQDIYENAPVFKNLRAREETLRGHCRDCRYCSICGGCRGRAWAYTGDYLAEDPSCFVRNREFNLPGPKV
jgi:radical SAM protein with 4Fe4S-binding SPASM domain